MESITSYDTVCHTPFSHRAGSSADLVRRMRESGCTVLLGSRLEAMVAHRQSDLVTYEWGAAWTPMRRLRSRAVFCAQWSAEGKQTNCRTSVTRGGAVPDQALSRLP